ncbi:DUF1822 family protein [Nostoc sp. CALU 546]|uniref:DUF1822 family protein n=1 Tax=Nostoc sp. CALU 546 TaxID=1867241 RepID=UPI003B67F0BE
MINNPNSSINLRLLLPEVIYLEPEHLNWAKDISQYPYNETYQWQTYLNALALVGFEQWLKEHLPQEPIQRKNNLIESLMFLQVGEFKLYVLATENLLNEVVNFPKNSIDNPDFLAHLYVVIEVLEEQQEIIIRGFIRCDHLLNYLHITNSQIIQNNFYDIPLSEFDPEPNHLLFYSRFLEEASIPLPTIADASTDKKLEQYLQKNITKLGQWLQGEFDAGWQAIEELINPNKNLSLGLRNIDQGVKRGRLIDLGIQLGNQYVVLLVNITPKNDNKLSVLIQLHPQIGQKFLQQNIRLSLVSTMGNILCEVNSRSQDNYIQLNTFKGEPGQLFAVEVSLGDIRLRENFEL